MHADSMYVCICVSPCACAYPQYTPMHKHGYVCALSDPQEFVEGRSVVLSRGECGRGCSGDDEDGPHRVEVIVRGRARGQLNGGDPKGPVRGNKLCNTTQEQPEREEGGCATRNKHKNSFFAMSACTKCLLFHRTLVQSRSQAPSSMVSRFGFSAWPLWWTAPQTPRNRLT